MDALQQSVAATKLWLGKCVRPVGASKKSDLLSRLYDGIPAEDKHEELRQRDSVIKYAFVQLVRINDAARQDQVGTLLGLRDLQVVHSLVELVFYVSIRAFTPQASLPRADGNSALAPLAANTETNADKLADSVLQVLEILRKQTFVSGAIKARQLPNLVASVLFLESSHLTDISERLMSEANIAPVALLRACNVLLSNGSRMDANARTRKFMTKVFLRPQGFTAAMEYVLQPGYNGEVSIEQYKLLTDLIAASPEDLTLETYLSRILPPVLVALDDTSDVKRRGARVVLRELINRHADHSSKMMPTIVSSIANCITKCTTCVDEVDRELLRLSMLTENDDLSEALHNFLAKPVVLLAYAAHSQGLFDRRDMCIRLLIRFARGDQQHIKLVDYWCNLIATPFSVPAQPHGSHSEHADFFHHILGNGSIEKSSFLEFYKLLSVTPASDIAAFMNITLLASIPIKYAKIFHNSSSSITEFADLASTSQTDTCVLTMLNAVKTIAEGPAAAEKMQISSIDFTLEKLGKVARSKRDGTVERRIQQLTHTIIQQLQLLQLRKEGIMATDSAQVSLEAVQVSKAPYEVFSTLPGQTTPELFRPKNQEKTIDGSNLPAVREKYREAVNDMTDEVISNRAHGLYLISDLCKQARSASTHNVLRSVMNVGKVVDAAISLLGDAEDFVSANAVKALVQLILTFDEVGNMLFQNHKDSMRFSAKVRTGISQALHTVATETDNESLKERVRAL